MSLTDLKSYYMQLPSDPQDYPYLVFSWRQGIFIHRRLPFGCRSSCLHAQQVTEAVCKVYPHVSGHHVTGYVDDYPSINERPVAAPAYTQLHGVIDGFGLGRSPEKCEVPGDERLCLGIVYYMPTRTLGLPQQKLDRALGTIAEWLQADRVTKSQIETLVGFLNHIGIVVPAGRPFNALLYDALNSDNLPLTLDLETKRDLEMWQEFLTNSFTNCSSMKRLISVPTNYPVALAVRGHTCVIRCDEINVGYRINSPWDIPHHLMPAVAVWAITEFHLDSIMGQVICVSVPTKVAAQVINRVSTRCKRIRPMLRHMWLRQARSDTLIKAISASSNVGWLYSDYVEFYDVDFPY